MVDNPAPQPENPPTSTPDMPPPPPPTPEAPVTPTLPVKPSTPNTPPPPNPRIKAAKPTNWPVIILSLLLLVAIGFAVSFGYLYYQSSQEPPIATQPSPTPTPDPTANWETYRNNEIRASFKYPQQNQNDISLEIYISPLNLTHLSLREIGSSDLFLDVVMLENTELEDWYQKAYGATKQKQPNPPTLTTGPTISGIQSTQSTFNITGYGEAIHIFVPAGNNLYQIMIPNNNNDLQNQILSTFEFVDPTADWGLHSFSNFGLSFSYPGDVSVKEENRIDGLVAIVSTNTATMTIKPNQPGIGFENPDLEITQNPLFINEQQLQLANTKIEKTTIFNTAEETTSYMIIVPYPDQKDYSIMVTYESRNGIVDDNSNNLFDQILSTFEFTD